jgi:hypothetical protein
MKNLLFIFIFIFAGCSSHILTPQERLDVATKLAQSNALKTRTFTTSTFDIYAYQKTFTCKYEMSVYIEGDGLSWITSSRISKNPTPFNPMALKLMVQDNSTCKIYLARPCQYVQNKLCDESYWTNARFSPKVIQTYEQILDTLAEKSEIKQFKLYGFSGGGTVATLLAAKRKDIQQLVTIAGNLDIDFWTKKNYLTPLTGSLNPANFSQELSSIKQLHLIGTEDNVIDKSVFNSYKRHFKNTQNIHSLSFSGYSHSCCWDKKWREILQDIESFK